MLILGYLNLKKIGNVINKNATVGYLQITKAIKTDKSINKALTVPNEIPS